MAVYFVIWATSGWMATVGQCVDRSLLLRTFSDYQVYRINGNGNRLRSCVIIFIQILCIRAAVKSVAERQGGRAMQ